MIFLFTDFGCEGPYLGQMEAALKQQVPGVQVINLLSNAPRGEPRWSSYLLAALSREFSMESVFLAVVDPGVGGERLPVVLNADGRWFVGPDNGLFNTVAVQANTPEWRMIDWCPENLSTSFHGRDLFAPIAGKIATNDLTWPSRYYRGPDLSDWSTDLWEVIFFDHYGNAVTGVRYREEFEGKALRINEHRVSQAETFCKVPIGNLFWYRNSMGMIEIAANRRSAEQVAGLSFGDRFQWE
jgi:S-adenosylmethionine hydrolase